MPRTPPELFTVILSFQRHTSTLYSCCLVSRAFYACSILRLYEHVDLAWQPMRWTDYTRTIQQCPSFALHLQQLTLSRSTTTLEILAPLTSLFTNITRLCLHFSGQPIVHFHDVLVSLKQHLLPKVIHLEIADVHGLNFLELLHYAPRMQTLTLAYCSSWPEARAHTEASKADQERHPLNAITFLDLESSILSGTTETILDTFQGTIPALVIGGCPERMLNPNIHIENAMHLTRQFQDTLVRFHMGNWLAVPAHRIRFDVINRPPHDNSVRDGQFV